jgi:hypothetical protein
MGICFLRYQLILTVFYFIVSSLYLELPESYLTSDPLISTPLSSNIRINLEKLMVTYLVLKSLSLIPKEDLRKSAASERNKQDNLRLNP